MNAKDRAKEYGDLMAAASSYVHEERPKAGNPEDVYRLMLPLTEGALQERFWVLLLDTRNGVKKIHLATLGLVDRTQIHAREIFREAIAANASRVLLVHNHPSGDAAPSPQDIECTRTLVSAGKIIGIEVLDHVVIGERTPNTPRPWVSFREVNLL